MARAEAKYTLTAVDRTAAAVNSAKRNFGGLSTALSGIKRQLAGLAVGLSVVAFTRMIRGAIDSADKIEKMSRRLGIGTVALSQFGHIAELSGASLETMANGIRYMQKNMSDAEDGLTTAKRAFAEIGIPIADLKRMDPGKQFEIIGDAIAGLDSQARRTQVAMAIFGRSGSQLIPIFDQGRGAIKAMREEADRLGITLSEKDAKAAADAKDAMTRLNSALDGVKRQIALGLAPEITSLANDLAYVLPDIIDNTVAGFHRFNNAVIDASSALIKFDIWRQKAFGTVPEALGGGGWSREINDVIVAGMEEYLRILQEGRQETDVNIIRQERLKAIYEGTINTVVPLAAGVSELTDAQKEAAKITEQTRTPFEIYRDSLEHLADILEEVGETWLPTYRRAVDEATAAYVKSTDTISSRAARISKEMRTPFEIYRDTLNELADILESMGDAWLPTYRRAVDDATAKYVSATQRMDDASAETARGIGEVFRESARGISYAFSDAMMDSANAMEYFGSMAKRIIADVIAYMAELYFVTPILNKILPGKAATSGASLPINLPLPPHRQHGGAVTSNRPYIVGESGPELFVPRQSGAIVPGGAAASAGPPINVTWQIQAIDTQSGYKFIEGNMPYFVGRLQQEFRKRNMRGPLG